MNDRVFTLLAVLAVCVTAIVLFRGHRKALTNADRAQIEELRERVRVLEQIVTDGGLNTAAQIEALREQSQHQIERGQSPSGAVPKCPLSTNSDISAAGAVNLSDHRQL